MYPHTLTHTRAHTKGPVTFAFGHYNDKEALTMLTCAVPLALLSVLSPGPFHPDCHRAGKGLPTSDTASG